jgi:hypothetical protein
MNITDRRKQFQLLILKCYFAGKVQQLLLLLGQLPVEVLQPRQQQRRRRRDRVPFPDLGRTSVTPATEIPTMSED